MNESITVYEETIDEENLEQFIAENKDVIDLTKQMLEDKDSEKSQAEKNETLINSKLFKKTHQAKYLIKHADHYENLANNLLFTYYHNHMWQCGFDKKSKLLYIINLICPNNIPSFSLVGIKSLDDFTKLVLAGGKKILVEENLDGKVSEEEFNKRLLVAKQVAEKYKD